MTIILPTAHVGGDLPDSGKHQPPLGQPPVGQPSLGQPSLGQPSLGQPPLGQPSLGQLPLPLLNQTRVLSMPPQQHLTPITFRQDSESLSAESAVPTGSTDKTQDSSLRGSQASLVSFKPDVLLGGSQREIAFKTRHGFQKMPPHTSKPPAADRQYSIDAHADPRGQIAIMTPQGSKVQNDLSPQSLRPQQTMPLSGTVQKSPVTVARGPLQWGSPPSLSTTTASPFHQVPTSISPNKGGTVSWGVPPSTTSSPPKQVVPPPPLASTTAQHKPSNGGVSLGHSSSVPSLVNTPANLLPFLSQKPGVNGPPLPFGSLKLGGSTNPLCELKRSEPLGDLTQIRTSAQKGSSPAGGGISGDGLVVHQASSASVPNVAMTTKSETPLSLAAVPTTTSTLPPFSIARGFTASTVASTQKPLSTGLPTSSSTPFTFGGPTAVSSSTTTSSQKPLTTGLASLLSASKTLPASSSSTSASKPAFPFGTLPGVPPLFTFSPGSTIAPSFTSSQSQPQKTTAMSATPTTNQSSGSIFSSMPKFSLDASSGGFTFSKTYPFQFPAPSSTSAVTTSSTQASSKSDTSGLASEPLPSQLQTTTAGTIKPSSIFTSASSLSSPLQSTGTTTTKPFPFTAPSSSAFVFGDKSGSVSLSSTFPGLTMMKSDTSKLQDKDEREEVKEDSESDSNGGSTDGSGEDQSLSDKLEPQGDTSQQQTATTAPSTVGSLLPASLPAAQKLPSEDGVSKNIPQIAKPTTPKPPPSETGSKDEHTVPDDTAKPKASEPSDEQEASNKEEKGIEKTQTKPSPPPPVHSETVEEIKEQPAAEASKQALERSEANEVGTKVKDDEKRTVPPTTVTPVPVVTPQPPTTTATSGSDKSAPQPTSLLKDSKQTPSLPAADKAEETTAGTAKVGAGPPETSIADKGKQPSVEKPAITSATGLSFTGVQQQLRMGVSGSQSSLLSLDDLDTEADMEGEMEGMMYIHAVLMCGSACVQY